MINETLKMLRTINGVTGKELSTELGISASYLSEIENGKKAPPFDLLERYAKYFKVKLSTLVLFAEEQEDNQVKVSAKTKTRDTLFRFMKFLDKIETGDTNDESSPSVSD